MRLSGPSRVRPCHVVILCHPQENSLNASIARVYCETVEAFGHRTVLRDLYRMPFDPILKADERPDAATYILHDDILVELDLLREADTVVLVYPIWFGLPPAMIKGYVDRVLGANFHYLAIRDRSAGAALRNKHLLSITTSGNSKQWLEARGTWVSLLRVFDHYLQDAFSIKSSNHIHLGNISTPLADRWVKVELNKIKDVARKTASRLANHDVVGETVSS